MRLLIKLLPDSLVEKIYMEAGRCYGNVVSYLPIAGVSVNMNSLFRKWEKWEKEYARRGFITVSLDRFVEFGGYDNPIDDIIGKRREEGEKPILYSEINRN